MYSRHNTDFIYLYIYMYLFSKKWVNIYDEILKMYHLNIFYGYMGSGGADVGGFLRWILLGLLFCSLGQ